MVMGNANSAVTISLPPPPSPLSAAISNGARLLSPRTWIGLMQVSSRSPFSGFDLKSFVNSAIGLALPMLILACCDAGQMTSPVPRERPCYSLRKLVHYFLSPWMCQCLWQFCLQAQKFISTMISHVGSRNEVLPCAIQELQNRLSNQRAYQTRRYVVYLPPMMEEEEETIRSRDAPNDGTNEQRSTNYHNAVILFPGALVPSGAYSELAGRLSDKGMIVIVPSLEPCLLAAPNLGTDIRPICRTMGEVQAQLKLDQKYVHWCLMGHSMGAFAAMRLYDQFQQGKHHKHMKGEMRIKIRDLILNGVTPFIKECTNLSAYDNAAQTRILLIQATDDILMTILGDKADQLYSNFPSATTIRKDIAGATHHGFASYSDQGGQISMQEQQCQVCEHITDFLRLKNH